ncbi:hypothetical protein ACIA49_14385 [Kribbella sp. NPDC051587]|uniref:hypothetical protein n=1 Tax=Kribbella sp. NPDC051587 TaxID=3364119 RepID=UPI00378C34D6
MVTTGTAALVMAVFTGCLTTVRYVDGLNDLTALPDVCASPALSRNRLARFETPLGMPRTVDADSVSCSFHSPGNGRTEVMIDLTKLAGSRSATRRLKGEAPDSGTESTQLGDEGIRYPFEEFRSGEILGIAVESRIDNILLRVRFGRDESLGTPEFAGLQALASELVQELEAQKPR